jgi:hypothetical protein
LTVQNVYSPTRLSFVVWAKDIAVKATSAITTNNTVDLRNFMKILLKIDK